MNSQPDLSSRRIGFISTRISGTDGVSLEIGKWADVLTRMGHECFYVAGQCEFSLERSVVIPEAHFLHPVVKEINDACFGHTRREQHISTLIREVAGRIKRKLYEAIKQLRLDLIIAENALTIPMNVPLAAALDEVINETRIPCIAHHHDFVWERERFLVNCIHDYISALFPPRDPLMGHVVINSLAGAEFGRRTGLPYHVVPNVMDFHNPPPPPDDYTADFRQSIGLTPDDRLILQPTRVVGRKGIEHSVELVRRLDDPRCKLVISHDHTDEGEEYKERIIWFARMLGVDVIFASDIIKDMRGTTADGRKIYSIGDAYRHADFVTYPSTYEGFGNAFLEAVYYKKPIFCNRYTIYQTDIEPFGFQTIKMNGFVTHAAVEEVRRVLSDPDAAREMVEHNYELGRRYFSYERVEAELRGLLTQPWRSHCD